MTTTSGLVASGLAWLEASALGQLARETRWLFLAAETAHFMGLSVLIGSLAVLELRMLGVARRVPIAPLMSLVPLALGGFALNLMSGLVMLAADPMRYWSNAWFRLKLLLVLLAGLNALWFWVVEHRRLAASDPGAPAATSARVTAALSLGLWLAVLVLGRFLPYVEGGTDV